MRRSFTAFALAGLAVAVLAIVLAGWLGRSIADQRTVLIAAAVLAVGDVAAALWVAGADERKRRPVAWARCGLVAAALSFVVLLAVIIPAVFVVFADARAGAARAYAVVAFALLSGLFLVWLSLRLAWRRAAPKVGA